MSDFESLGLKAGNWTGILMRPTAPKRVMLTHLGQPVAEARIRADQLCHLITGQIHRLFGLPAETVGAGGRVTEGSVHR